MGWFEIGQYVGKLNPLRSAAILEVTSRSCRHAPQGSKSRHNWLFTAQISWYYPHSLQVARGLPHASLCPYSSCVTVPPLLFFKEISKHVLQIVHLNLIPALFGSVNPHSQHFLLIIPPLQRLFPWSFELHRHHIKTSMIASCDAAVQRSRSVSSEQLAHPYPSPCWPETTGKASLVWCQIGVYQRGNWRES